MPSITDRLATRSFPSICADGSAADRNCAFDGKEGPFAESAISTWARHDLILLPPDKLGLHWAGTFPGDATAFTADSILRARKWRADLQRANPRAIVLADMPVAVDQVAILPLSSPLWRRGPGGHVDTMITDHGILAHLDWETPAFRALAQRRVHAVMDTRVVDGVALRSVPVDSPQRLALIQAVRQAVGAHGLILLESGTSNPVLAGPLVNGLMVVDDGKGRPVWPHFPDVCAWARDHLQQPRFTVLEMLATHDRTRLYEMRMATTLSLVSGDGFVAFGDTAGHDWYDFWSPKLGRPQAKAYVKGGAYRREFANGTVIFNPPTNQTVYVEFAALHTSAARSLTGSRFSVQPGDGDIDLSKSSAP